MPEASIQALRDAIRGLHGCDSAFVEAVPVTERFRGRTVWEGVVSVFDLIGHPVATRCYAWSHETEGGKRRFYAVLALPPVSSAVDAVRASILADQEVHAEKWACLKCLHPNPAGAQFCEECGHHVAGTGPLI